MTRNEEVYLNRPPHKHKIVFICPYCYPLFSPRYRTMFGGWEVRISQVARSLARQGNYKVSIIVADHGQPHIETREGVELISWQGKKFWGVTREAGEAAPPAAPAERPAAQHAPTAGRRSFLRRMIRDVKAAYKEQVPWKTRIILSGLAVGARDALIHWLRGWFNSIITFVISPFEGLISFFKRVYRAYSIARDSIGHIADEPVFPEMIQIFEEADADLYIAPGNNQIAAQVAYFCKTHKRAYIMLAGSDMDFNPRIKADPYGKDIYGEPHSMMLYAIQNACLAIVQNERQYELAQQFGAKPVLIRNPVDLELKYPKAGVPSTILWVGNTEESVKRPAIMVEVARSMPEYQFVMVVTPVIEESYRRLEEAARSIPNLEVVSRVPYAEIEKYFAQAKLFVNTSAFEGFPNTFLQAGKYGVPIISMKVDPNRLISEHGCGLLCSDDPGLLRENIHRLMSDPVLYERYSAQILQYVRKYHDIAIITPQYEAAFQTALECNGGSNRPERPA